MSFFKKVNSLPIAEETGVGEKATEVANKLVTEALRHEKGSAREGDGALGRDKVQNR